VHHNERERQWHRQEYRSGLQPSPVTRNTSWGCAPCWYRPAPSALHQPKNALSQNGTTR
jgi:hypothetical protein